MRWHRRRRPVNDAAGCSGDTQGIGSWLGGRRCSCSWGWSCWPAGTRNEPQLPTELHRATMYAL